MRFRESKVEADLVTEAARLGIDTYKLSGQGKVGKTDRIFFRKGHCAFVEVKKPGETPDPIQLRRIEKHNEEGTPAIWVDNFVEGIRFLKKHLL